MVALLVQLVARMLWRPRGRWMSVIGCLNRKTVAILGGVSLVPVASPMKYGHKCFIFLSTGRNTVSSDLSELLL